MSRVSGHVLTRVTSQATSKPLRALYEWFGTVDKCRSKALQMLALLPHLETMCQNVAVWGLTTRVNLWLLPTDDPEGPWLVVIKPRPSGFVIGYRPLGAKSSDLNVETPASTIDEALDLVREGMIRSGGWGNPDKPGSAA
jgi:hypothetical protein